jgi:hypothetical protein
VSRVDDKVFSLAPSACGAASQYERVLPVMATFNWVMRLSSTGRRVPQ